MTAFAFYDTSGEVRQIEANCEPDDMRIWLSMFKTECMVERKAYEYNHFVNWLAKYHDVKVVYAPLKRVRVDM